MLVVEFVVELELVVFVVLLVVVVLLLVVLVVELVVELEVELDVVLVGKAWKDTIWVKSKFSKSREASSSLCNILLVVSVSE